jgi:hypothetical protein
MQLMQLCGGRKKMINVKEGEQSGLVSLRHACVQQLLRVGEGREGEQVIIN